MEGLETGGGPILVCHGSGFSSRYLGDLAGRGAWA
jgi:hypothetical protein